MGVAPIDFRFIRSITDPNTATDDPATYHMYAVVAWEGGEPRILDNEHSELRWFSFEDAASLPDLALEGYRNLLREVADGISRHAC